MIYIKIYENTQFGPFQPLFFKTGRAKYPKPIPAFILCNGTLCNNFIRIGQLELKLSIGNEASTDAECAIKFYNLKKLFAVV